MFGLDDAIIGAGISGLAGIASSALGASMAGRNAMNMTSHQMKLNKNYAEWEAKNLPSYQREGLVKAGYNPLLNLSNIGSMTSPSNFSSSAPEPDFSSAVSSAIDTYQSMTRRKQIDKQSQLMDAQIEAAKAQANSANSVARLNDLEASYGPRVNLQSGMNGGLNLFGLGGRLGQSGSISAPLSILQSMGKIDVNSANTVNDFTRSIDTLPPEYRRNLEMFLEQAKGVQK